MECEARMTLPTFCTHSECLRRRCCLGRQFLWTSPAWPRWYWEARDPLRLIGCAGAAAANDSTGVLQRARIAAWAICPSRGPFFSPLPAATRIRSARSHCADRPPPISRFLTTDQEKSRGERVCVVPKTRQVKSVPVLITGDASEFPQSTTRRLLTI